MRRYAEARERICEASACEAEIASLYLTEWLPTFSSVMAAAVMGAAEAESKEKSVSAMAHSARETRVCVAAGRSSLKPCRCRTERPPRG